MCMNTVCMHTTNERTFERSLVLSNVRTFVSFFERSLVRSFVYSFVRIAKFEQNQRVATLLSSLFSLFCVCVCVGAALSLSLSRVRVLQRGKNLRGKSKRSKHAHWAISIHA
jgi:hypothetical protein